MLMIGHPDDVPGGPLVSTEAAIFERKQREKKQAAAEADPQLAAEQRKKEEDREEKRQADRAARKEARRGRRSKKEVAEESAVWAQVDELFSLVQMDARRARLAREEAARAKAPAPAATPTEGGADGNAGGGSQQSAMAGGAGALPSSSVAAATGQNDTAWQQQQQQHQEAEEEEVVGGRPTQPISMPPAAFLQSAQPQTSRQPAKPQPRVGAEASAVRLQETRSGARAGTANANHDGAEKEGSPPKGMAGPSCGTAAATSTKPADEAEEAEEVESDAVMLIAHSMGCEVAPAASATATTAAAAIATGADAARHDRAARTLAALAGAAAATPPASEVSKASAASSGLPSNLRHGGLARRRGGVQHEVRPGANNNPTLGAPSPTDAQLSPVPLPRSAAAAKRDRQGTTLRPMATSGAPLPSGGWLPADGESPAGAPGAAAAAAHASSSRPANVEAAAAVDMSSAARAATKAAGEGAAALSLDGAHASSSQLARQLDSSQSAAAARPGRRTTRHSQLQPPAGNSVPVSAESGAAANLDAVDDQEAAPRGGHACGEEAGEEPAGREQSRKRKRTAATSNASSSSAPAAAATGAVTAAGGASANGAIPQINDRYFVPSSLWPHEAARQTDFGLGWLATVLGVESAPGKKRKGAQKSADACTTVHFCCDGDGDLISELLLPAFREHCQPLALTVGQPDERAEETRQAPGSASGGYSLRRTASALCAALEKEKERRSEAIPPPPIFFGEIDVPGPAGCTPAAAKATTAKAAVDEGPSSEALSAARMSLRPTPSHLHARASTAQSGGASPTASAEPHESSARTHPPRSTGSGVGSAPGMAPTSGSTQSSTSAASAAPTRKGSDRAADRYYERFPHLAPPSSKVTRSASRDSFHVERTASGGDPRLAGAASARRSGGGGSSSSKAVASDSPMPPPPVPFPNLRQTASHMERQRQGASAERASNHKAAVSADDEDALPVQEPKVYRSASKEGVNRLRMKRLSA